MPGDRRGARALAAGSACGGGGAQRGVGSRDPGSAARAGVVGPPRERARPARADRPARRDILRRWLAGRRQAGSRCRERHVGAGAQPRPQPRPARGGPPRRADARQRGRTATPHCARDVVLRGRLFALLGGSTALGDHLITHPDRWRRLTADAPDPCTDVDTRTATLLAAVGADPAAPLAGAEGGAAAAVTDSEAVHALRTAYRDDMLALAAADLAAVSEPSLPMLPAEEVAAELADIAAPPCTAGLALAVAEGRGAAARAGWRSSRWARPAAASSTTSATSTSSSSPSRSTPATPRRRAEQRHAWPRAHADLPGGRLGGRRALRPEGKAGRAGPHPRRARAYYEQWASTWEFQALLKMRPVAGDPDLGRAYVEARRAAGVEGRRARPASSPRCRRCAAGSRSNIPPAIRPTGSSSSGRGGLRDVEFAVQLLQLVHGRADPSLRLGGTLPALAALVAGGYVGREDAATLVASYRFLRTVEHRLQLLRLRRTHLLPDRRRSSCAGWPGRWATSPTTAATRSTCCRPSWRCTPARCAGCTRSCSTGRCCPRWPACPASSCSWARRRRATGCAALGFADPEGALRHLAALTGGVSPVGVDAEVPAAGAAADLRRAAPTRTPGCWPTGRSARRSAATSGTCGCCATRARWPSGWRSCSGSSQYIAGAAHPHARGAAAAGRRRPARAATRDRPAALAARCGRRAGGTPTRRPPDAARSAAPAGAAADRRAPTCSAGSTSSRSAAALTDVAVATLQAGWTSRVRGDAPDTGAGADGPDSPSSAWAGSAAARWATAPTPTSCSCTEPATGADERGRARRRDAVAHTLRRLLGEPAPGPGVRGGRRPAAGGPAGRAGRAACRRSASTTQRWVVGLGGAGAAAGRAGRRRRGARRGLRRADRPDPLPGRRADRRAGRRDPPDQGAGGRRAAAPRRRPGHPHQARPRRPGRRRVDRAAAAAAARRGDTRSCRSPPTVDGAARRSPRPGCWTADDAEALRSALGAGHPRPQRDLPGARAGPSDQLPRPGLELAGVARACGYGPDIDPGQFLDDYRRTTRHARAVVEQVFYGW